MVFAPPNLGGNGQRYLLAEHVVSLVRELTYFLNSDSEAGKGARNRLFAAKLSTGRIGSRQQLAGGVSWGCSGGAQRSYGDHLHPIRLRFHGKPLF